MCKILDLVGLEGAEDFKSRPSALQLSRSCFITILLILFGCYGNYYFVHLFEGHLKGMLHLS